MITKTTIAALAGAAVAVTAPIALAATGPMTFTPIAGSAYDLGSASWDLPFVTPAGYTQEMVNDETKLDISPGVDDLGDMLTQNETGPQRGRYLYRTQEVGSNGAVVAIDLTTNDAKVIAQDAGYRRLDGIRWTPWGTLLFAEETTGGRLFEAILDPADPSTVIAVEERRALGILAHEGIEALANGEVYVIDELTGGGIFKFVPDRRGDLSSGRLFALKGSNADGTGQGEWIALDRTAVTVDARAEAAAKGASGYERPEDVEVIGRDLFVAITGTDRVLRVNLDTLEITNFVKAGVNVPVENQAAKVTGLNNPDNLAQGPDGRLWIVEDNDFSDIFRAEADTDRDGAADAVELFASLKDRGAETSGIYFGADPKTLFLNIQHPDKPLADGTWKITRR